MVSKYFERTVVPLAMPVDAIFITFPPSPSTYPSCMALVACSNERQALELGRISILALLASAIDIASIGAQEQ